MTDEAMVARAAKSDLEIISKFAGTLDEEFTVTIGRVMSAGLETLGDTPITAAELRWFHYATRFAATGRLSAVYRQIVTTLVTETGHEAKIILSIALHRGVTVFLDTNQLELVSQTRDREREAQAHTARAGFRVIHGGK